MHAAGKVQPDAAADFSVYAAARHAAASRFRKIRPHCAGRVHRVPQLLRYQAGTLKYGMMTAIHWGCCPMCFARVLLCIFVLQARAVESETPGSHRGSDWEPSLESAADEETCPARTLTQQRCPSLDNMGVSSPLHFHRLPDGSGTMVIHIFAVWSRHGVRFL